MKIKIFEVNQNGKIEFTKNELEQLLNKTYDEGYVEGAKSNFSNITWANPCGDKNSTGETSTWTTNHTEPVKTETPKTNSYTIKINGKPVENLTELFSTCFNAIPPKQMDAFDKLGKELNF